LKATTKKEKTTKNPALFFVVGFQISHQLQESSVSFNESFKGSLILWRTEKELDNFFFLVLRSQKIQTSRFQAAAAAPPGA